MTNFIWPSDRDRAESDELNRVCEYLEEVWDERDALAAHVELVKQRAQDVTEDGSSKNWTALRMDALQAPGTSLALQKAQWQAEALHEEANLLDTAPQLTPYHRIDAKAVAKVLRERAELRRQAEKQAEALIEYHQYRKDASNKGREPMSAHEWASEVLERCRQAEEPPK